MKVKPVHSTTNLLLLLLVLFWSLFFIFLFYFIFSLPQTLVSEPNGKRFCMNSTAMYFIPAHALEQAGMCETAYDQLRKGLTCFLGYANFVPRFGPPIFGIVEASLVQRLTIIESSNTVDQRPRYFLEWNGERYPMKRMD